MTLVIDRLSQRRGGHTILQDISLSFAEGTRCLLIGRNGAGKTSLLRLAARLDLAAAGKIESALDEVGYFAHQSLLYADLSVRENLELFSDLTGGNCNLNDILAAWVLTDQADRLVRSLSRGELTRASLARAFLGSPKLLILDEPTNALDDGSLARLQDRLMSYQEDAVVVVASHDVERLAAWANRIVVLDAGRVMADTSTMSGTAAESKSFAIELYRRSNR